MKEKRPDPPGDPIQAYFREALLIGGEASRLYLVRHAQSQGNTGEDLTTGDPDLTDVGCEQARRLGERLKSQRVDRIYASPLRRTQQTRPQSRRPAGSMSSRRTICAKLCWGRPTTTSASFLQGNARAWPG